MTTSHRPQLEARNGAKNVEYVPTSTQHARLLPGHKEVKYRNRKRMVTDTLGKDTDTKKKRARKFEMEKDAAAGVVNEEEAEEELQGTNSSDEYDEEEDESEDEEALLEELNMVRQERMANKSEQQVLSSSKELPKQRKQGGWRSDSVFGRKSETKGKDTSSSSHTGSKNKTEKYVNDLTKSDYHKEFLRNFVK